MTMADLRDLLGTTRKYAVPIGEYLDRIGLTRRDGDVRRLGQPWTRARRTRATSRALSLPGIAPGLSGIIMLGCNL